MKNLSRRRMRSRLRDEFDSRKEATVLDQRRRGTFRVSPAWSETSNPARSVSSVLEGRDFGEDFFVRIVEQVRRELEGPMEVGVEAERQRAFLLVDLCWHQRNSSPLQQNCH